MANLTFGYFWMLTTPLLENANTFQPFYYSPIKCLLLLQESQRPAIAISIYMYIL